MTWYRKSQADLSGLFDPKLIEFSELGYGWFDPDGELHPCPYFNHLQSLVNNADKYPEIAAKIEESRETLQSIEEDMQALVEEGEHPEGHRYDMAKDSFDSEIADMAYQRGWIRLSTDGGWSYQKRTSLIAEGTPESLQSKGDDLRKLKNELNDLRMFNKEAPVHLVLREWKF